MIALSAAQTRLWFLSRLFPGSGRFTLHASIEVDGAVSTSALARALERALQALMDRHPILRSRFVEQGDTAAVVFDSPTPAVEVDAAPSGSLDELAFANKDRPFSLSEGPLVRLRLIRMAPARHALLFAVHHVVADGRSLSVLYEELFRLANNESLAPVPALYTGDVQITPAAESYWAARLAPAAPTMNLLGPRAGGAVETRRHVRPLQDGERAALEARTRELGIDRKTLCYAATACLLGLLASENDVLIGAPEDPEPRAIVGPIGRMVPLRIDTRGTLREIVKRTEQARAEASRHALPFERILELVEPERDVERPALLEVIVAFPPPPPPTLALRIDEHSLAVRFLAVQRTAAYDLAIVMTPNAIVLEYDAMRAEHGAIAAFANQLARALAVPLDAPFSASLLEDCSVAPIDTPLASPALGHALIEAWITRTPDAEAIASLDQRLTYAELSARADRLADRLAQAGVTRGDAVGVLLPGSVDAVVAVLAIWRAGGAFVAFHPELPESRMRSMVEACRPRVVITRGAVIGGMTALLLEGPGAPPRTPLVLDTHDLAYIVFTSGSTGTPKGVLVEHHGLANMTAALGAAYDVHAGDRVLQFASVSFDAYLSELLMALGRGATLVVPDEESRRAGAPLIDLLARERITTVTLPPSVLAMLPGALPRSLRTVVSAGEALEAKVAAPYLARGRVVNGYGPSEATVCSTTGEVRADEPVTIGRPLPGTRAVVLDNALRPLPRGFRGELWVSGVHLSRGYIGDPALTAERFRPDPFGEPGARMYRTGDLVTPREDGRLRYTGRRDHQVKLRGMRIELGDIGAALRTLEGVRDALVLLRDPGPDASLCAYLLVDKGAHANLPALARARALERLPAFMVPQHVVVLHAWPLTPNGKVDHRALPPPSRTGESPLDLWGPRNATERAIVEIAEALLGRPVSVHSDFFDLGGHSLLALRFVEQIAKRLGVRVPLGSLFRARTIEKIAAELGVPSRRTASSPSLTPLHVPAEPRRRPLFLVHPIHGYPLCYLELVRRLEADRPVYAFQAVGLEGEAAPLGTNEAIAARYAAELRAVQPKGPYQIGGWSSGGSIAYEIATQLLAAGEEVSLLALIDTTAVTPAHYAEAKRFVGEYPPEIVGYIYAKNLGRTAGVDLPITPTTFMGMDDETYLSGILGVMKQFHVVETSMDIAALRPMLDVFKATLRAFHEYRAQPLACRVVTFETVHGNPEYVRPSWQELVGHDIERVTLPGNHFDVIYPPHVDALAEALKARLA